MGSYEVRYYDILKVKCDASEEDIRKAYKRQALIAHPGKPTENKQHFDRLAKALELWMNAG